MSLFSFTLLQYVLFCTLSQCLNHPHLKPRMERMQLFMFLVFIAGPTPLHSCYFWHIISTIYLSLIKANLFLLFLNDYCSCPFNFEFYFISKLIKMHGLHCPKLPLFSFTSWGKQIYILYPLF